MGIQLMLLLLGLLKGLNGFTSLTWMRHLVEVKIEHCFVESLWRFHESRSNYLGAYVMMQVGRQHSKLVLLG
jgi:hypothetical protein